MMNKIRRRLLLAAGNKPSGIIFKSGTGKINGEIVRQKNLRILTTKFWIDCTGYVSIKADFTNFKTLNIELSLLTDTNHGTKYGYGTSATDFTRSTVKYSAAIEVKTFDISSVTGERYINFIGGDYTDSPNTYISNLWLE